MENQLLVNLDLLPTNSLKSVRDSMMGTVTVVDHCSVDKKWAIRVAAACRLENSDIYALVHAHRLGLLCRHIYH